MMMRKKGDETDSHPAMTRQFHPLDRLVVYLAALVHMNNSAPKDGEMEDGIEQEQQGDIEERTGDDLVHSHIRLEE